MLKDAHQLVFALMNKGHSEKQVLAINPLKKYAEQWSWSFISTEKMTQQVYRSLSQ